MPGLYHELVTEMLAIELRKTFEIAQSEKQSRDYSFNSLGRSKIVWEFSTTSQTISES